MATCIVTVGAGNLPNLLDRAQADEAAKPNQVPVYFDGLGTGNKAYRVNLEVLPDQYGKLSTLDKLHVKSSSGTVLPLSTIMHRTHGSGSAAGDQPSKPGSVGRHFLQAERRSFLSDAVKQIQQAEASMGVPLTVQGSFHGHRTGRSGVAQQRALSDRRGFCGRVQMGVGLLPMLLIFGYQLAVIGIIPLAGVVKKNGVHFATSAERRDGSSLHDAIRQSCLLRFRPILMTTMAAMPSGLPLMLESGAGSELHKPLEYSMVGGPILSQVLTLYTTPVIYLYLDRLQSRLLPNRASRMPRAWRRRCKTPSAKATLGRHTSGGVT